MMRRGEKTKNNAQIYRARDSGLVAHPLSIADQKACIGYAEILRADCTAFPKVGGTDRPLPGKPER